MVGNGKLALKQITFDYNTCKEMKNLENLRCLSFKTNPIQIATDRNEVRKTDRKRERGGAAEG